MTDLVGEARLGPGAVRVDIQRASIGALVLGIVLFGALTAGAVYAAVTASDTGTGVVGWVFAGFFLVLLLIMLLATPAAVRPRGVAFDSVGVHFWHGPNWDLVPWGEIARCGIAYELPPSLPSIPMSIVDAAADAAEEQIKKMLKYEGKRKIAFEIFPVRVELSDRHPQLVRYRKADKEPPPGLVSVRWRIPIPPAFGTVKTILRGGEAFAGAHWMGWFRRAWTGGARLGQAS